MMKSSDKGTRDLATKFSAEMGGLRKTIKDFSTTWGVEAIRRSPVDFCRDCDKVFAALTKRIEAEDALLYHLYDKLP